MKAISELRDVTYWCHTILLAAQHKRAHPALTPASKAGTRFTYPGRMEGRVDLGALITPLPGIEPMTAIMCYTNLHFTYLVSACRLR